MASKTPPLHTEGRFVVSAPYTLNPDLLYKCMAIRSFSDCYKRGEDVYFRYYEPYGLIDGQSGFSFQEQVSASANIITLQSQNGDHLYIPDTYILSYPITSEIKYNRVVLSVDLGMLPDTVDLTLLQGAIGDLATGITGVVDNVVNIHTAPVESNPDATLHVQYEQTRLGHVSITQTSAEQLLVAQQRITELEENVLLLAQYIN